MKVRKEAKRHHRGGSQKMVPGSGILIFCEHKAVSINLNRVNLSIPHINNFSIYTFFYSCPKNSFALRGPEKNEKNKKLAKYKKLKLK